MSLWELNKASVCCVCVSKCVLLPNYCKVFHCTWHNFFMLDNVFLTHLASSSSSSSRNALQFKYSAFILPPPCYMCHWDKRSPNVGISSAAVGNFQWKRTVADVIRREVSYFRCILKLLIFLAVINIYWIKRRWNKSLPLKSSAAYPRLQSNSSGRGE